MDQSQAQTHTSIKTIRVRRLGNVGEISRESNSCGMSGDTRGQTSCHPRSQTTRMGVTHWRKGAGRFGNKLTTTLKKNRQRRSERFLVSRVRNKHGKSSIQKEHQRKTTTPRSRMKTETSQSRGREEGNGVSTNIRNRKI